MKDLNIEEMTSLRGGQTFDISNSFNNSNVAAIVSAGNQALATSENFGGSVSVTAAQAGNQTIQFRQG
jgi:hypothetical protein